MATTGLQGLALLLLLLIPSGALAEVSDSGWIGCWERPSHAGYSRIAISATADGYRFAWKLADGRRAVSCDESGLCEELLDGKLRYRWRFNVIELPGGDGLMVEAIGSSPDKTSERQYTDRFELQPGGLELRSYATRVGDQEIRDAQPLEFHKVSDDPNAIDQP